jgi:hypothetical protein
MSENHENPSKLNSTRNVARRPRLADNFVRVQFQKSNGQIMVTIPRGLARCLRLQAGDVLEVFIERGDLVLRIKERDKG